MLESMHRRKELTSSIVRRPKLHRGPRVERWPMPGQSLSLGAIQVNGFSTSRNWRGAAPGERPGFPGQGIAATDRAAVWSKEEPRGFGENGPCPSSSEPKTRGGREEGSSPDRRTRITRHRRSRRLRSRKNWDRSAGNPGSRTHPGKETGPVHRRRFRKR